MDHGRSALGESWIALWLLPTTGERDILTTVAGYDN